MLGIKASTGNKQKPIDQILIRFHMIHFNAISGVVKGRPHRWDLNAWYGNLRALYCYDVVFCVAYEVGT